MRSNLEDVRRELLEKVASLEDEILLKRLLEIMESTEMEESKVFMCADSAHEDSYQSMIDDAIADSEAGRVIAFDEFKDLWEKRLVDAK